MEQRKQLNTNPNEYWQGFLKCMAKLEEAFGREMTEGRGGIYFENLHSYRIAEIDAAVNRAIREQEFFPSVATLINFIKEQRQEERERWPSIGLEYKEEDRPELSSEEAKKLIKGICEKMDEAARKTAKEERKAEAEKKKYREKRMGTLLYQRTVILGQV